MLEVLAAAGALTDLIATGARLVEPDARVVSGELYGPQRPGVAMQTSDHEPHAGAGRGRSAVVASAETLAFAVATGEVGDPRSFKRPVRVTVPRALPTDDVLVARKAERGDGGNKKSEPARAVLRRELPEAFPVWRAALTLELVDGAKVGGEGEQGREAVAAVCATLDEVRDLTARAPEIAHAVRAVIAPYIPSALVTLRSEEH